MILLEGFFIHQRLGGGVAQTVTANFGEDTLYTTQDGTTRIATPDALSRIVVDGITFGGNLDGTLQLEINGLNRTFYSQANGMIDLDCLDIDLGDPGDPLDAILPTSGQFELRLDFHTRPSG